MSPNFRLFNNEPNDDAYWAWLRSNSEGYVVNPKRNQKANDFKYHRVNCMHIADPSPNFSFTTKRKKKICSNDLEEALNELKKYKGFNGVFNPCSTCNKSQHSAGEVDA